MHFHSSLTVDPFTDHTTLHDSNWQTNCLINPFTEIFFFCKVKHVKHLIERVNTAKPEKSVC